MKHVIKISGKIEDFSKTKLQKSVRSSLHAVHCADDASEEIVQKVLTSFAEWLKNKHEVSTLDIRAFVAKELAKYNKDAAVLYKNHRDMW